MQARSSDTIWTISRVTTCFWACCINTKHDEHAKESQGEEGVAKLKI